MTTLQHLEYYKRFVAIICRQAGFKGISSTALESMADVTTLYMRELLVTAHGYAELACRTQPNITDITHAFAELRIDIGQLVEFNLQMEQITHEMQDRANKLHKTKRKSAKMEDEANGQIESVETEKSCTEEEDTSNLVPLPEYVPSHLPRFPAHQAD